VTVTTVVGYLVSVGIGQLWLYPLFEVEVTLADNFGLTAGFVGVSMLLKYGFRRLFNSLKMFTEPTGDPQFTGSLKMFTEPTGDPQFTGSHVWGCEDIED
jgi:hypothetical protein